ncbi:cobalamin biosynthesis protein [Streptomyces sp. NPDC057235]|uniref:cobalamin biosynthesis protein n=1 Tax=Streptomyces sp. NPDC057235 TaxID=3346058 RepID=UPI003626D452
MDAVLREAGLPRAAVRTLATLGARAAEPGIAGAAALLGVPVRGFAAEELAAVSVPHPSALPLAVTGTASVAEAAALLAADGGAGAPGGTGTDGGAGAGAGTGADGDAGERVGTAAGADVTVAGGAAEPVARARAVLLVPKRRTRRVTCALAASVPVRSHEDAPAVRLLPPSHGYIAGEPGSPPHHPHPPHDGGHGHAHAYRRPRPSPPR